MTVTHREVELADATRQSQKDRIAQSRPKPAPPEPVSKAVPPTVKVTRSPRPISSADGAASSSGEGSQLRSGEGNPPIAPAPAPDSDGPIRWVRPPKYRTALVPPGSVVLSADNWKRVEKLIERETKRAEQ
jgi:hypothetical protein